MELFARLEKHPGPSQTAAELANACGAEANLLERLLRHLAAKGVIAEQDRGGNACYYRTRLSGALASPEGSSGIRHVAKLYMPVCQQVPRFLEETGYTTPKDVQNGPFQQAVGAPGTFSKTLAP